MVAYLRREQDAAHDFGERSEASLTLQPGQIAGLSGVPGSGLTRVGLFLIAPYAISGSLVYLDVRGWANPAAAWEMGIPADRLVIVRNEDVVTWSRIVASLLAGVRGVYAEVPKGVNDGVLRKLAAKARVSRTPLVLRPLHGRLPGGVAHLHLDARSVSWEGTEAGHGALTRRRTLFEASGKWSRGMERTIEIEDNGTNHLRVVSHMGAATARYSA